MFENFRIFTGLMFIEASSNIKHLVYKATVYANNNNAMMYSGHGMEWNGKWNGTEISVWNMEDARMEWNGRFQEWNGRQSSILPYRFHTRFRALYLQKKYIPMSGSDE